MKYIITLAALCTMLTACDTAVLPTIAGAGTNGGVVTGGGTGGGGSNDVLKVVPGSIELIVGTRITLTTNTSTPVSWRSDTPSVVSITTDGVATAGAPGVAVITATTQSGTARSATATITVRDH